MDNQSYFHQLMYPSEAQWFSENPTLPGKAGGEWPNLDGRVLINPHWSETATPAKIQSVIENERMRIKLAQMGITPAATPIFSMPHAPYSQDSTATRHTLAARQMTGDPSGGTPTPQQQSFNSWVRGQ